MIPTPRRPREEPSQSHDPRNKVEERDNVHSKSKRDTVQEPLGAGKPVHHHTSRRVPIGNGAAEHKAPMTPPEFSAVVFGVVCAFRQGARWPLAGRLPFLPFIATQWRRIARAAERFGSACKGKYALIRRARLRCTLCAGQGAGQTLPAKVQRGK